MTRVGTVLALICVLAGLAVYATVGAQQKGPSKSERAVYRSVLGHWTSSEDFDLPLEEMSLL